MMNKQDFTQKLGELIHEALPNIVTCEYERKENGEEYVIATCQNRYQYKICVTADSLISLAKDTIKFLEYK